MKKHFLFVLAIFMVLSSCAKNKKDAIVTIHTSQGDMTVLLYEETPLHKANFIKLVEEGAYDSTLWHRVIKEFMIQGGDIDKKRGVRSDATISAEIVDGLYHEKGALAAARQPDRFNPNKSSSWCQFYIVQGRKYTKIELTVDQVRLNKAVGQLMRYENYKDLKEKFMALQEKQDIDAMNELALTCIDDAERELNIDLKKDISPERLELYTTVGGTPFLDEEYTVFGKVVEGLDIIDKIAVVKVAGRNKPVEDIYLTMEIEWLSKKKITKLYGYQYPKD